MKTWLKYFIMALIVVIIDDKLLYFKCNPSTVSFAAALYSGKNDYIHLKNIPKKRIDALISVEDPNFYDHNGFDFTTNGVGATTITEEIVKNLAKGSCSEKFNTFFGKIQLSLISWSTSISKDNQLIIFINTAYFGSMNGKEVRGFSEASSIYYNKKFNNLSYMEYLSLVAMLVDPKIFNIKNNLENNIKRVSLIKKLLEGEYVTTEKSDILYGQKI